MENSRKGIIFILLSSLLLGSYGVWSKLMGPYFDVFFQTWTRSLIIIIILFPILYFNQKIVPIQKEDWKWLAIFLAFTSFTVAPFYYAFTHMDIGAASLLFFSTMLLTMYVIGILFFKEKLTKIKIISFILAGIGMYYLFSFSLAIFPLLAVLAAILNGIASGGEVSFSKKLTDKYSPLYILWLSFLAIFITNAPMSFILGENIPIPSFSIEWGYLLAFSILSIFAFWTIITGLKYIEAGIGGLIGLMEIIFSIAFGIILFHEILTLKIAIGALIIISAAALPHVYELLQKRINQQGTKFFYK